MTTLQDVTRGCLQAGVPGVPNSQSVPTSLEGRERGDRSPGAVPLCADTGCSAELALVEALASLPLLVYLGPFHPRNVSKLSHCQ